MRKSIKASDCYGTVLETVKQNKLSKAKRDSEHRDDPTPGGTRTVQHCCLTKLNKTKFNNSFVDQITKCFVKQFSDESFNNAEVPMITENSLAVVPTNTQTTVAIPQKKVAPQMVKPKWHAPWKLYRVISGHLGWVRSCAVEPGNEWFATGSADRVIKVSLCVTQIKFFVKHSFKKI